MSVINLKVKYVGDTNEAEKQAVHISMSFHLHLKAGLEFQFRRIRV